jgi:acetoin utilization deacetylase AcuC-like enzyme
MIGLIYDDLFLAHGVDWHPEKGERLSAIMSRLEDSGAMSRLVPLEFEAASLEQVAWLHDEDYIEMLAEVSGRGGELFPPDTVATAKTYEAAMLAAGGCIAAALASLSDGPMRSLCLVRPPGHHALAHRPMGFCFFNNIALAAEAVLRNGLERVAIVDFDVHHGNGTQDMFYHRREVLYISLHERGIFPGTGSLDEVGVEDGAGFNINIPLESGACDEHYQRACEQVIGPALDEFQPQLLLVSAGYDAHHSEQLAHMNLSIRAFHEMTRILVEASKRHADGRLVIVLEGGYNLQWMPLGIENTLLALAGEPSLEVADDPRPVHQLQITRVEDALEHVIATHRERLGL